LNVDKPAGTPKIEWWKVAISLPAALVALVTLYTLAYPKPKPADVAGQPAPIPDSSPAANPASALTIASADLEVTKFKEHFLIFLPGRTIPWYQVDMVAVNSSATDLSECYANFMHAEPDGGRGRGTLFLGSWTVFYDKGATFYFDMPAKKTLHQQFFFEGTEQKPSWLRIRIACQKPSLEISPYRDVDLAHSTGW
jgi:hypothetical protein